MARRKTTRRIDHAGLAKLVAAVLAGFGALLGGIAAVIQAIRPFFGF
jgi:hypothetical protein